jgi:hypothetical protein
VLEASERGEWSMNNRQRIVGDILSSAGAVTFCGIFATWCGCPWEYAAGMAVSAFAFLVGFGIWFRSGVLQ